MTFDIAAQTGTSSVRPQHRFDQRALETWMRANVDGFRGPLRVDQFKGGQSNPTYRLITPACSYVLRRKPPGELLKGAHAIDREATVLAALSRGGYPVPRMHALCLDETVIGTAFYLMDMVEGRIFWDATLPGLPANDRSAYFNAMNSTVARLHDIDYAAIGLSHFGKHGGYVERQIATWSRQYLSDTAAGRDPNMDRLIEWLPVNLPNEPETSLVHGDFRIDNLIFHPSEPRILAVLDWELSTLGNPFADFAYHAMMYRMPPLIVPGLAGSDIAAMNIPSERMYVEAYGEHRGIPVTDYEFYVVFGLFRFAAIIHGIKGRVIRGTASNAEARARAEAFPRLAALAWAQVGRTK